jgi:putative PIN family toxin of toxin-antitoxin system
MEKKPPRVVIDSNVVISGLVFGGNPYIVLLLAVSGYIRSVVSRVILSEIEEALERKFPLSLDDKKLTIQEFAAESINVELIGERISVVRDLDDNKIIETAIQGKCDFIITGDKDLLKLKKYQNIKIVTPQQFLDTFIAQ